MKKLSTDTGASMAFYLRRAVEKVLAEHGIRIPKAKQLTRYATAASRRRR
jgi:hypothetical protein